MSGLPTYAYMPAMQNVAQCQMGVSEETRSTLTAGGTFFRSITTGLQANDIAISITQNSTISTLTIYYSVTGLTETFTVPITTTSTTTVGTGGIVTTTPDPAFTTLRDEVNASSTLISMPIRGTDIRDTGGVDAPLLVAFPSTAMIGGAGLPAVPAMSGDYTGPYRSLWRVTLSERNSPTGLLEQENISYEWNSSEWIVYTAFD